MRTRLVYIFVCSSTVPGVHSKPLQAQQEVPQIAAAWWRRGAGNLAGAALLICAGPGRAAVGLQQYSDDVN